MTRQPRIALATALGLAAIAFSAARAADRPNLVKNADFETRGARHGPPGRFRHPRRRRAAVCRYQR